MAGVLSLTFRGASISISFALLASCVATLSSCERRPDEKKPEHRVDSPSPQTAEEYLQKQESSAKLAPPGKIDMESWKLSNECAEAAARFWKLAGYRDGETKSNYTNHFNKYLGKCLIRLTDMTRSDGKLVTEDRIYDAVEHVLLVEHLVPLTGPEVLQINGELVPATPESRARIEALMQQ